MALIGLQPGREVYWFSTAGGKMAKWLKEFPMALKSRSGSKPGLVITAGTKTTQKDGKVWDTLLSGKGRKNNRAGAMLEEQHRPQRTPAAAFNYISRMIRVDKQDKNSYLYTVSSPGETPAAQCKTETLIIVDDYADPFDAQKTREQRDAGRVGENDGYMEPYDAQQMITDYGCILTDPEIRRRGSKDLLKVCMSMDGSEGPAEKGQPAAIYENPYKGSSDGDMKTRAKLKLDRRPATEYELTWEWRKEQVVRSLSAQFDNSIKEDKCDHTLTRQTQPQHLRQKSRSQKTLRSSHPTLLLSSVSFSSLDGEACGVDLLLPLEKQSWYHGCVTWQEAEFQLQSCKEASFLVRNSESDNSKFSIALKTSQGCVHIIIAQTKENCYTLDQSSCVFPSIPEVVHHYSTRRLPFNGAEHMTLLHPVPRIH